MPAEVYHESTPILDDYPSLEVFEEFLAEAIYNASSARAKAFVARLDEQYRKEGTSLLMTAPERLYLRRLSTGAEL